MPFKIVILLFLSAAAFAAKVEPIAPYFGFWSGEGTTPAGIYKVTLTLAQTGPFITGSYKAAPKGRGEFASGSYRGKLRPDGCYDITVTPMSAVIARVQLTACLSPDKVITVKSMFLSGTGTPFNDFTKCVVDAGGPLAGFKGTLYKKDGKPAKKKKAGKKNAPEPDPEPPLAPITLEMKPK